MMKRAKTPLDVRRIVRSRPLTKGLLAGFCAMGWEDELEAVYARGAELFALHDQASPALMMHLTQLLPMIAMYEAALRRTKSRDEAMAFMERWAFTEAEKMMRAARGLMKLGVYRLMPWLCGFLLDRMFGEKAGFSYRLVSGEPGFAADMTRCPYVETCARYGCPELTRIACLSDDMTYGKLHPDLVWGRTQTLGMGGTCCDFRLYVRRKKR